MRHIDFFAVQLNLQQGIVHTGLVDVSNATAAIFDRFKKKIIVRPEYKGYETEIEAAVRTTSGGHPEYSIGYGDGFQTDTWDKNLYPPTPGDGLFREEDVVKIVKTVISDMDGARTDEQCTTDAYVYIHTWMKKARKSFFVSKISSIFAS